MKSLTVCVMVALGVTAGFAQEPTGDDLGPPPESILAPSYPPLALLAGVQGTVILELGQSNDGKVDEVKVVQGQPMSLSEAAIRAAREWRFPPYSRPATRIVRFDFVLQDEGSEAAGPTLVTADHVRIPGTRPRPLWSSHGPADRPTVEDQPFSRFRRTGDGEYVASPVPPSGRCYSTSSSLAGPRARAYCLPGSTLRTGGCAGESESVLLSSSHPQEDSWRCAAAEGSGRVRAHAVCCWPN